jgi:hypothetical protein
VTVDIEGNVSLRGSSNFTELIDGRPAVMEPSEALQQIPASTIENNEIITNPSAKYDPEGAAGMINIILKKDERQGRSGMVNLNAGFGNKYGGDFLYDYKDGNYHATLGADYNNRSFTGSDREENQTTHENLSSFILSDGDSRRRDISLGLRGDLELELGRKDALRLGGRYGHRQSQRGADLSYIEWAEPAAEKLFYASATDRDRERDFYALTLSYQHRFAPKGHELYAEMFFSRRQGEEATTHGLRASDGAIISGHRATEAGPSHDLRAKLDYTLALGKEAKFEAGYQSEFDRSDDIVDHTSMIRFNTRMCCSRNSATGRGMTKTSTRFTPLLQANGTARDFKPACAVNICIARLSRQQRRSGSRLIAGIIFRRFIFPVSLRRDSKPWPTTHAVSSVPMAVISSLF